MSACDHRPAWALALVLAAVGPTGACAAERVGATGPATEAYKYRLPDGGVLYTDERQPEGRLQQVIPLPGPAPAAAPSGAAPGAASPGALERAADERTARLEAAATEVQDAQRALARAEQELREGREPEAGERLGRSGGGSRLAPDYWQRQAELRAEVEHARARLDAANAALAAER